MTEEKTPGAVGYRHQRSPKQALWMGGEVARMWPKYEREMKCRWCALARAIDEVGANVSPAEDPWDSPCKDGAHADVYRSPRIGGRTAPEQASFYPPPHWSEREPGCDDIEEEPVF